MRYPVKANGLLGKGELFFDATPKKGVGAPDGMKVDTAGNVWSTGPGGVWIFSPEGKHLGTIRVPERTGNLTFGASDNKTRYITASSHVYRVRVLQAGIATPDRRNNNLLTKSK